VVVEEVLKGVWFESRAIISGTKLAPGQAAILLLPYIIPDHDTPVLTGGAPEGQAKAWAIRPDGTVATGGIPAHSPGMPAGRVGPLTVDVIRAYVSDYSPGEAGLSNQVRDALLFPERFAQFQARDSSRARYVAMAAVVLDLHRDVPSLAALLESPDSEVRARAGQRLRSMFPATSIVLTGDDAISLHKWSLAWRQWWKSEHARLIWNEHSQAWEAGKSSRFSRAWPSVPSSYEPPTDTAPLNLLEAVKKSDPRGLAEAYRSWLDSGVLRDRSIAEICRLQGNMINTGRLREVCGVPRLQPELLLDDNVPARDRFWALARFAYLRFHNRFEEERDGARQVITNSDPCSETVRRAYFWEPSDAALQTVGKTAIGIMALEKLAVCQEERARALIAARFLMTRSRDGFYQIVVRLQAGDEPLAQLLLAATGQNCDDAAVWASRVLALAGDSRIIPGLLRFIESNDAQCRKTAAWNLVEIPNATSVARLRRAIETEHDRDARAFELIALAEIGDPSTLDFLLNSANEPQSRGTAIAIVRGLARIRDPLALKTLATIALNAKDDQQLAWESVSAFGYISGLYKGFPPHPVRSAGGIQPDTMRQGLEVIANWVESHRQ
jgi:HEAT repeat protein